MYNKLEWAQKFAAIRSKISKFIGTMFKIKSRLPLLISLQIFKTLFSRSFGDLLLNDSTLFIIAIEIE